MKKFGHTGTRLSNLGVMIITQTYVCIMFAEVTMTKYDYVKVLLYAYPKLDALAEAEECGAENRALLSFREKRDALFLAERIAENIVIA